MTWRTQIADLRRQRGEQINRRTWNLVLRTISPTAVSVAILFEILGASVIARVAFGETPPLAAWPAAVLIAIGVVVVVRSGDDASDRIDPGGVLT